MLETQFGKQETNILVIFSAKLENQRVERRGLSFKNETGTFKKNPAVTRMNTRNRELPRIKKVDLLTNKNGGIKNLTCFACRNMFVYMFLSFVCLLEFFDMT